MAATEITPAAAASRPSTKETPSGGFGIYRSGQGYWVRVLSAIFSGVLMLAGAGWAWNELEAIRLPTPNWSVRFENPTGTAGAGQALVLYSEATQPPTEIGTCSTVSAGVNEMVVTSIAMKDVPNEDRQYAMSEATRVQTTDGAFSATITDRSGLEIFNKVYLQAGVVSLLLVCGAACIYWLVAARPNSVDFLVDTDGEMKKVNWSTRKNIIDSTWVVVGATFLIAAVLWIFDVMLSEFFKLIKVLET